jgi:hypothetical protein
MISQKKKYHTFTTARSILAVSMMFLLLLLTTANYFVYMSGETKASIGLLALGDDDKEAFPGSPAGPDEKPPGAPVSISEEFLHGHSENSDPFITDQLFTHMVTTSEKIELVHFELLSPPPEC